jgi:cleavage and polyadenylation specificity factor subunit 1
LHDFTANLAGKVVFTKLDLVWAYNQVPIAADDIHKTAVTTPFGLFEFPVMCFGLCNATQTFQRLVNSVLAGLDFVFAYVNDVLIASVSADQHVEHVRTVLGRFSEFGIAINPAKCVFAADSLTFLRHIVERPNPDNVNTIRLWPQPSTKKELQRFLGSLNFYHRFIPDAAKLQAPLYAIATAVKKRDDLLSRTDTTREAFSACREILANTAWLVHPQRDSPLRLSTDASNIAVGAVLEQFAGGDWQPLGFFSRKLSGAQTRYSAYDRELLAAYLATRHFVHKIEGRHVTLRTDHRPLLFMFTQKTEKLIDRQS